MRRGNERRIVLAIRWDGASWDRVPSWMGAVLPLLGSTPVQWSFPNPPADFRDWPAESFVSPIRERMNAGDALIPAGFSGAPHPLLAIDELEKELSWTAKNPWATGIMEVFGVKPSLLAPGMPDLTRPAAVEACRAAGFVWIAMEDGFGPALTLDGLMIQPYRTASYGQPPSTAAGRELRQALDRGRSPLLFLNLPSFPSAAVLESYLRDFLEMLSGQGIGIASLDAVKNPPNPQAMETAPSVLQSPAQTIQSIRKKLDAASPLQKKKRKKNDDYREILSILSSPDPAPRGPGAGEKAAGSARADGKVLIAHMQGDVALSGRHFDVRIRGGRFCGIERQGRRVTPDYPAASSITVMGKTSPFKSRTSVSFEHGDGTGLRDELAAEMELSRGRKDTAGLTVEYEFQEGSPELLISAELRYPRCGEVVIEGTSPLVLALSELAGDEPAVIAVTCPDGSGSRHLIRERDGWRPIPGMQWTMEADGLMIHLAASPASERQWGLCLFRVTRRRGRRIVEANPFGSSTPVSGQWVSGLTERHSILIGLDAGVPAQAGRRANAGRKDT